MGGVAGERRHRDADRRANTSSAAVFHAIDLFRTAPRNILFGLAGVAKFQKEWQRPYMEIVAPDHAPRGLVLVIHSWWGLTRSFRDYAGRLAEAGFAAGLSDLFDGKTAGDEKTARMLRRAPRKLPMYKTLTADIEEILRFGGGRFPNVGVIGFSMGGHWAVWLSQQPDLPIGSTVLYYAARSGDFAASRSAFLAHFADHDPWVKPETRRRMEKAIASANRPYAAFDYPGAGHWFAETGRPDDYDAAAAALALQRTLHHLEARKE